MKNQTTNKKSVLEIVNERIIEKLERGVNPWRKPWVFPGQVADANIVACNYISNKAYTGVNAILLEPGYYLTFKQIQQIGGKLKKGSKAHMVVFSKNYLKKVKTEETKPDGTIEVVEDVEKRFTLKYYNVFRLDDVENYKEIKGRGSSEIKGLFDTKSEEQVDGIIKDYCKRGHVTLQINVQDRAYYQPLTHRVCLPSAKQFKELAEYYSTAFHELGHSTGHQTLLNREELTALAGFGSDPYAKEELIAEITASYCCNYLGVSSDASDENSVAYLKSWASRLSGNTANWFILNAMTKATEAFKLIMNLKEDEENDEEQQGEDA